MLDRNLIFHFQFQTLQDSAGDTVEKFKLKMKTEDGKDYDEEVEIDTKKETETFHVPKTSPNIKESDVILDFKKVSDMRSLLACRILLSSPPKGDEQEI